MLEWITANLGTIVVSAVLVLVIGLIIARMIKNKKSGKPSCSCGCGCSECAFHSQCHKE
ncbi:MAG: FeoB-associated Cys-rich membrane protein [Oscillospiraceae bacterium]